MKKKESGIAVDIIQRLVIALITGIIAALIVALLAYILCGNFLPKVYVSNISFTVHGANANATTVSESLKTPGFSEKVAARLTEKGETTIYENIYKRIDSSLSKGNEMITVSVISEDDAKEAYRIADGAENVLSEWVGSMFGEGASVTVISHANLPSAQETRNITTYVLIAAAVAGFLVFAITALTLNLSDTINDSSQITRRYYVDVIADFPYSERPLTPASGHKEEEK